MTLRGNVIVQKARPENNSQVLAIYNDARGSNLTLNVVALYNTVVGNGGKAAFVHLANGDHTPMRAILCNNILSGVGRPYSIQYTNNGSVSGMKNWLPNGAATGSLTGSVLTGSPGFLDAAAGDFRLVDTSPCIGAASTATPLEPPVKEYFLNENNNRRWRIRDTARDIGAFESTSTNSPVGPYEVRRNQN
jgi:hypothetical protein